MILFSNKQKSFRNALALSFVSLVGLATLSAEEEVLDLPTLRVVEYEIAEQAPVSTFSMPVSLLRYEPRVDIQRRSAGELQSDVSVRGSTFEAVGFVVGASPLFDPQTGHYFAEIPITTRMLTGPEVLVGAANARTGFNATTATVAYGWRPIEERGEASVFGGDNSTYGGSLYHGLMLAESESWGKLALDAEAAFSRSDGARPQGDSSLDRYNVRLQHRNTEGQTDLFGGYQAKFFGWPNLYTPFSDRESENLQTTFLALNHHRDRDHGGNLEFAVSYRRNKDEYQFNRDNPTDDFQHETKVWSASWIGREEGGEWFIDHGGRVVWDEIESNSLTFGDFQSRSYQQFSFVPGVRGELGDEIDWEASAGLVAYRSDRDGGRVSPQGRLEWAHDRNQQRWTWHLEYSEASRFPAYTTLNSNPGGLFGGDASLGRELARNYELGARIQDADWALEGAVFWREDRDLADWVLVPGQIFREAEPVDIDTLGIEVFYYRPFAQGEVRLGYTFLHKEESYRRDEVTGSFYALNFPTHRATVGGDWHLHDRVVLRGDLEIRRQEDNPLREGRRSPVMAVVGLDVQPFEDHPLMVGLTVDNVFNVSFEEVPGTPGLPRQFVARASLAW
ncbi:MAG: hypothetical protein LAT58_10945 [Opitutales bacterium]|nr:hypothetical protein [Opitutales bacterium]